MVRKPFCIGRENTNAPAAYNLIRYANLRSSQDPVLLELYGAQRKGARQQGEPIRSKTPDIRPRVVRLPGRDR